MTTFDIILKSWPIIVALVGLCWGAIKIYFDVQSLKKEQKEIQEGEVSAEDIKKEVLKDLEVVMSNLKEDSKDIKREFKDVLDEVKIENKEVLEQIHKLDIKLAQLITVVEVSTQIKLPKA